MNKFTTTPVERVAKVLIDTRESHIQPYQPGQNEKLKRQNEQRISEKEEKERIALELFQEKGEIIYSETEVDINNIDENLDSEAEEARAQEKEKAKAKEISKVATKEKFETEKQKEEKKKKEVQTKESKRKETLEIPKLSRTNLSKAAENVITKNNELVKHLVELKRQYQDNIHFINKQLNAIEASARPGSSTEPVPKKPRFQGKTL